jgi:autotransporter translocation and assembly factor TamB
MYDSIILKGIDINQNMTSNGFFADYKIAELILADSISLNAIDFLCNGTQGLLSSSLKWDPNGKNSSVLSWQTLIRHSNDFLFTVEPSFFSINDIRWDIDSISTIALVNSDVNFNNLQLIRKSQKINIDGKLSKNLDEKLIVEFKDINLSEISQLLNLDIQLAGLFNWTGAITNSDNGYQHSAIAELKQLEINNDLVGDIKFNTNFDSKSESLELKGNLEYRSLPTLEFVGAYFMKRERDNLEMALKFNNTDLSFVNGFMDPAVIKGIAGKLSGNLSVKGSVSAPELSGELKLLNTGANIELLGVRYTLDGDITIKKNQIEIKKQPVKVKDQDGVKVKDQDGNIAYLTGGINHTNFDKWDYRFTLNFQEETNNKFNKSNNSNRFLLLNTKYREGDYYFGKAYDRYRY